MPTYEWVIEPDDTRKKVRTKEEKARRKAATDAAKVFKEKLCTICGENYTPTFQFGTKRWESSKYCSQQCKNDQHNADPAHKTRKNASRRENSALHRREYEQRIAKNGGTRWQVGDEKHREDMRQRNRNRYARLYGQDPEYTAERKANAAHQRGRRKKASSTAYLTPEQITYCKQLRVGTQALARELAIPLHVDHLRPLRRGGAEHPDNLLPMTAAANLFWGDRVKRCPWPKPAIWDEPSWEIPPRQG